MSSEYPKSSEPARLVFAPVYQGPQDLCDLCQLIEFDEVFRYHGHIFSHTTRSISYILDHQDCAFCWLTRRAISKPDLWSLPEEKWIITLGNFSGQLSFPYFDFNKELQDCLRNIPSCVIGFEILNKSERPGYFLSTVAHYRVQLLAPEYSHQNGRTKNSTYWRYRNFAGFKPSFEPKDQAVLDHLPDSIFCARPIQPLLDYELLNGWLQLCHSLHTEKCRPTPLTTQERAKFHFRLIDVHRDCIVDALLQAEYVCLSYVWSRIQQPRLISSTFNDFHRQGGLSEGHLDLPNSIRDKVILCRTLHLKHLWCDSLCIMQDNLTIFWHTQKAWTTYTDLPVSPS